MVSSFSFLLKNNKWGRGDEKAEILNIPRGQINCIFATKRRRGRGGADGKSAAETLPVMSFSGPPAGKTDGAREAAPLVGRSNRK